MKWSWDYVWLLLKRPVRFEAVFLFFPLEAREWTEVLVECGEVCQYYFSIFETADYTDCGKNTVLRRPLKRARPAGVTSQKARNSRVAPRVPDYFLNL
jgi:hypothetical protein